MSLGDWNLSTTVSVTKQGVILAAAPLSGSALLTELGLGVIGSIGDLKAAIVGLHPVWMMMPPWLCGWHPLPQSFSTCIFYMPPEALGPGQNDFRLAGRGVWILTSKRE